MSVKKTFITVPLDKLIPYENNPRINEPAIPDTIESIKQCENLDPIEIDEGFVILSGHTRLAALQQLGYTETEVVQYEGLTEEQKRKYRILANKTGEAAEWDFSKLEQELADLDFSDFSFDFGGIEDDVQSGGVQEVDAPEPPEEPRAKVGDLYALGNHRLICGDSTDAAVIDRLMDGARADMLLTDPPYNVDYTGKTKDALKIKNDKMDNDSFRQFLRDAFAIADSVMRAGAVFYIWHADSEGYNFRGACADNNWKVRECLIWNKNSMVLGRQDYQWKHEPCLYGWKDGASHLWASDRKQTTVLDFDRPTRSELHPTMKPVGLLAYQIGNNTHDGDSVLDLFGGSGSTLIACEQLNRKCYMCELDPKYVSVILQRYINFKGSDEDVFLLKDGKKIPYSEVK